jgi:preprotein translocase subunit YajC
MTLIDGWLVNPVAFAAEASGGLDLIRFILLFGPLFLIWYFLVIRPQSKQRARTRELLENLKTGDRVVTTGGIYGTIAGFRDTVVQLQVAKDVKIEVARSAIAGLQPDADGNARTAEAKEAAGKKKERTG